MMEPMPIVTPNTPKTEDRSWLVLPDLPLVDEARIFEVLKGVTPPDDEDPWP